MELIRISVTNYFGIDDMTPNAERARSLAQATTKAAVEMREVTKRFGDQWAVRNVDLSIREGEFFSVIGPSGCGKTTTLRLMSGLERPTSGTILIGGREVTRLPAYRRPINTVFQNYALFPHLSVYENIAFGLRERKTKKAEMERRVHAVMSLVQLSERADARPKELSGGQQQRVALARSLVLEPEVLLFDEPLGALDLKLRREMQIALREVHEKTGRAFVYVTHDQEEAFSMSDRVAVMDHGRVAQVASPREVYECPQSLYVAQFVGASNALEAKVTKTIGENAYTLDVLGIGTVTCNGVSGLAQGADVIVIARPETAIAAVPGNALVVHGRIAHTAFVGPYTNYFVFVSEGIALVQIQTTGAGLPGAPEPGTEVAVGWPSDRLWVVPRA